MNYREQAANEVAQAKENRNSGNNGGNTGRGFSDLDQIEVDMGETPFVKFYPTVALTGTVPDGEGNPIIRFRDESNNGHGHQGYLGIVLDDLRIDTDDSSNEGGFDMSEATIVETDDDDYTEYRAVNFGDEATSEKFGGEAVNIDGDQYGIEDQLTELDERVILVVDRTAAVSVAKKLDVAGGIPAGMDPDSPDDINSGLIEYASMAPEGADIDAPVSWRYARNPEMRAELIGDDLTLLVSRREEIDSGGTGYIGEDGQHDEPVVGYGEDEETHTDPTEASYEELTEATDENGAPEARGMMWYSVFDAEGTALQPLEGEDAGTSTNRPFLEWTFDATAGHLPDEQWEFVQEYQANNLPTDEETILDNVRENFEDADEEKIVGLIQNGAGQE
jgi:hypothetical protein